jgi:phosphohistidine phosphatase SixA
LFTSYFLNHPIKGIIKMKTLSVCSTGLIISLFLLMSTAQAQGNGHSGSHHQHSENSEIELLKNLKTGGNIIFLRHERTDVLKLDERGYKIENCATQRNLSVAGIANSQQTGDYIKRLGIPIGAVYSSPMCRTLETARYAFDRVEASPELMGDWAENKRTMDDAGRDLRAAINAHAKPETNTVFVAHFSNIFKAFNVRLQEGDAAIIRLNEKGEASVAGVIGANRWGDLLRDTFDSRPLATGTHHVPPKQP